MVISKLRLSNLGSLCYDAALSYHGWNTKSTRRKPQMFKPKQLVEAENAATAGPRGSLEKQVARRKEDKLRKQWKCDFLSVPGYAKEKD